MSTSMADDVGASRRSTSGRAQAFTSTWWAWIALGLFFLGVNGVDALLGLDDVTLPEGAVFLLRFVSLFLTWQWLEVECRPFRQGYPLDMGMFLYAAGLGWIPYYMWRNQGWRGLLKVVGLVAMWLATYLVAVGGAFVLRAFIGE